MSKTKNVDLKNSCDKVEEFTYLKQFTESELSDFKTDLSTIMIKADKIETRFKTIKDEFKAELDPLKKEVKELLTFIRDKARSITEECYIMYDGEYAVYFNADGDEVYRRPRTEAELQKTIFMAQREGTNN
jgi:endonuclease III